MLHSPTVTPTPDQSLTEVRCAILRRRIRASRPVENLIAELVFGHGGSMADAIRPAPNSAGVR